MIVLGSHCQEFVSARLLIKLESRCQDFGRLGVCIWRWRIEVNCFQSCDMLSYLHWQFPVGPKGQWVDGLAVIVKLAGVALGARDLMIVVINILVFDLHRLHETLLPLRNRFEDVHGLLKIIAAFAY